MYSENLMRHINIPMGMMNRVDKAEVDAAIAALPGYPDCSQDDVRAAAASGNRNAEFLVEISRGVGELAELAREWTGVQPD